MDSTELPAESWTATATDVPPLDESERRRILERYGFDPDVVATVEVDGFDTTPEGLSVRVRPVLWEEIE